MRRVFLMTLVLTLSGCAEFSGSAYPNEPKSPEEILSGYNYVPLDPLPVDVYVHPNCAGQTVGPVLEYLPDNSVRIAVRQLSGNGSVGFGPAKIGVQGNTYQVVLDYINADVSPMRFRTNGGDISRGIPPTSLTRIDDTRLPTGANDIVIPVYVGIGLRLTANVTVRSGTVNLSSLGALSAAAQAQRVTGSLIVQTLGITGKSVLGALPLPSELNPTTIQNAMQAMGSIKAIIYDQQNTILYPRVTGIYDPLPNTNQQLNQQMVNLIVSELSRERVPFWESCKNDTPVAGATPPPPPPPPAERGERGR